MQARKLDVFAHLLNAGFNEGHLDPLTLLHSEGSALHVQPLVTRTQGSSLLVLGKQFISS